MEKYFKPTKNKLGDKNRQEILNYINHCHIITEYTLGLLPGSYSKTLKNGYNPLYSICQYLENNGINLSNELEERDQGSKFGSYFDTPRIPFHGDTTAFLYDQNYLNYNEACKIAKNISICAEKKLN